MKQKLFENIGGNTFKLITESVEEVIPNTKLVREGLKKVFGAGNPSLSYKRIQGVGLGYIKHVEDAKKTAIQEARSLAKEYGYRDNENAQAFVKENDFSKLSAENPEHAMAKMGSDETDISNPAESQEVRIGTEISNIAWGIGKMISDDRQDVIEELRKIIVLTNELLAIHGKH